MSRPTITLAGREYPLFFSLAASAKLETQFGSLQAMGEVLDSKKAALVVPAVDFVLETLLQAGRVIGEAEGQELPPPLRCRPSDLIDVTDPAAMGAIFAAIAADSKREVVAEDSSKNGGATPGQ